ncbi:unnamed protein product, partial [Discosporangium mesarthrocarpum]
WVLVSEDDDLKDLKVTGDSYSEYMAAAEAEKIGRQAAEQAEEEEARAMETSPTGGRARGRSQGRSQGQEPLTMGRGAAKKMGRRNSRKLIPAADIAAAAAAAAKAARGEV